MNEDGVVREALEALARVCSQLDSLEREADAKLLAFVAQEARFYGGELAVLAGRLEASSRAAWDERSSAVA